MQYQNINEAAEAWGLSDLSKHSNRILFVEEDDYSSAGLHVTLRSDLSARAALEVFCDLMQDKPDEVSVTFTGREQRPTIRLWWD